MVNHTRKLESGKKKEGTLTQGGYTFSARRYIEINQYLSTIEYQNLWRELVYIACEVPDGTGGNKKRRGGGNQNQRDLPPGFGILLDGLREKLICGV